jgi:hypothetical protein
MSGRPKDCVGSGADAPENGTGQTKVDGRPLARIGGGDLPTVAVDPKNENVVYTASTVMWRSEDGGANGRPCAARQAATITRRFGSTRTIRTSCSSSRICEQQRQFKHALILAGSAC